MKNKNEIKGLTIPTEVMEAVGLDDMVTLTAFEGIIVLKNTDMTALQLIQTLNALDHMAVSLYDVLLSKFPKDKEDEDCESCSFCEEFMEDSIDVPAWAKEAVGLTSDTKLCIFAEEDSQRIVLEPVEYTHDITDIDEDTLLRLSDLGVCLGELNESIMRDEVIFCE